MSEYSREFEAFWAAYPRRDGQKRGKAPAFKAWVKMSAAQRHLATEDVGKRNRLNGWGRFIQDAERYLKNRGWEDAWTPNSGAANEIKPGQTQRTQTGPNLVERLAVAVARLNLCEHQRRAPCSYFGNAETGEVHGVVVPQCPVCKAYSQRIRVDELRAPANELRRLP